MLKTKKIAKNIDRKPKNYRNSCAKKIKTSKSKQIFAHKGLKCK